MSRPFPHWLSWMLDCPLWAILLSPKALADRLPIRPRDHILEVGSGSGYFSAELARRVPEGRVELLDVQPEMLAKARRKLSELANVGFTVADASCTLPFPPASFDLAVLVTVLGEVPDPGGAALRSLAALLRPSGVLAIHEILLDPDFIPRKRLTALAGPCGFALEAVSGLRWNYTAMFRRR